MIKEFIQKISFKVASFLNEAEGDKPHKINHALLKKAMIIDSPSFSALLPYRYFDPENNLFINEHSLGFGLELAPLAGADESIIESLSNLIKTKIPVGIDVQFIMWGNNKVGSMIDQSTERQAELGGIFEKMSILSNRYFKKAGRDSFYNKRKLPLSIRDYRCFCFISKESGYSQSAINALRDLREVMQAELSASSMTTVPVDLERFLGVIPNWLMPDESDLYPKSQNKPSGYAPLNEELLCPSFELELGEEALKISVQAASNDVTEATAKTEVVSLSVKNFPEEFALWMAPDNIMNLQRTSQGIRCPFLWSVHFRVLDQEKSKGKAFQKFMDLDRKANSPFAKWIPGTVEAASEWRYLRGKIESDALGLVMTHLNVVLFTDEAHRKSDIASSIAAFRFNGFELCVIPYLQLQSYLSVLPFMMSEGLFEDFKTLGRFKTVTTWNLVNLLPIISDYKFGKSGALLPTMRNQIAFYSPHDESLPANNFNVAISASSGAGKSFLVQVLIMQTFSQNGKVWVIDVGASQKKFCQMMGGVYIDAENVSLNPFTEVDDIQKEGEKIRDLLSILADPDGKTLDSVALKFLLDAINIAFSINGKKTQIDDVLFVLENTAEVSADPRCIDLVTLLSKYSSRGQYPKIFNEPSALKSNAKFVVLELGSLGEQPDLQKAVLFAYMLHVEHEMYRSDRAIPKMCVIDEAWRLLSGENKRAAQFIETGFRTSRKHNGSFVTITQDIRDFFQSKEAQAAWSNSDHKIIMRQNAKAFSDFVVREEYKNYFTPYQQSLIKGFGAAKENGFSEFMLMIDKMASFHRLFVDPFSRVMFSSAAKEVAAVESYVSSGLSLEESIYRVALENYGSEFSLLEAV